MSALSQDPKKFEQRCRDYLCNYVPFKGTECFVAGGFFQRMWHNIPIRDIDVYCSEDYWEEIQGEFFKAGFLMKRTRYDTEGPAKFINFTTPTGIGIDLIGFHKPRNISYPLLSFDFTVGMVRMNAYTILYGTNFLDEYAFLKDIDKKILKYNSNAPITGTDNNILTRMKKYLDMGYTIENEVLTEMYRALLNTTFTKWTSNY